MKKKMLRRDYLRKGLTAGGGMVFLAQGRSLKAEARTAAVGATNETLKTIYSMRTIHGNFKEQAIPDEQIEQILDAGLQAANSSNMQTYSIVVVKDRTKIRNLCGYTGSCLLLYCVDYNRIRDNAQYLNYTYYADNTVHFVTGSTNAILAAQTAVIAAKSLGIDSLLTNGIHRGDMERIWKLVDLPAEGCFPLIALVLGYPTTEPDHDRGRLDGPGIIHRETYHRATKEELAKITERYDDAKTYLATNDEWKKAGHKHFQDWLYGTWLRGSAKPAAAETQMLKLLKRSGFVELQKG